MFGSGCKLDDLFLVDRVLALARRIERRRQVAHDRVQQRLHALVAVGRAQINGREFLLDHRVANDVVNQVLADLFLAQQHLHQLVAVHRERFEHVVPGRRGLFLQGGRNRFLAHLLAVRAVEVNRLHRHQVDDALELLLAADRNLHQHGVAAELLLELPHDRLRVRAGAVHLVDERQPRHVVPLHLAIDRDRLRLHAAHRAQHENRAVEHAQAALHLDREVDVARRIDEVDRVVLPLERGGGAGDRDAALLLELHVVHGGAVAAAADVLDLVDAAGVVQNPLAQGRLARVDVGRDADVAKLS